MSKLVIVTHPNIEGSVINSKWVNELGKHSEKIAIHSLYEKYPDLKIDVAAEQELLSKYDEIIFQFPLHWFNVPFALKQYMDQVLTYGWAFGLGGDNLKGKKVGFAVSTGGSQETYETMVSLEELLKPVYVSFQYCGCELLPTHRLYGANQGITNEFIESNAKEYADWLL
ncbi:NAD(P)H-dependent oxidoreductase [Plebeiibacterium marinum]|uniref:NAD(P)H-dependent oxidoreductase n=1 Tax=Plebeiibacterium marinum TaxID=2992111 RepID=A0AAE3MH43_9BACT|nr:NAD(P)H-dependent oxidoreductase [Plebeiobacterium marinum]MCW3807375.1 NAD(P)H-dependent oxidoreductase [Plebeiobacterium marinum]